MMTNCCGEAAKSIEVNSTGTRQRRPQHELTLGQTTTDGKAYASLTGAAAERALAANFLKPN